MGTTMEPWIQLLVQVPLVAAFMWFVLTWSKSMDAAQEKRDQQWREFISTDRTVTIAALSDVSMQLTSVAQVLTDMREDLARHDSAARHAIDAAQAATLEMRMIRGTQPLKPEGVS
jgi:predicted outer membrane protein